MKPSDYLSFDSPPYQPLSEEVETFLRDAQNLTQEAGKLVEEVEALVNEQKHKKNGDKSGEGNTTIPRNLNNEPKEYKNMAQTNGTTQTNGNHPSQFHLSEEEQRMAATIAAGLAAANRPSLNDAAWTLGKVAVGAAVATSVSLAIKKYVFKMA